MIEEEIEFGELLESEEEDGGNFDLLQEENLFVESLFLKEQIIDIEEKDENKSDCLKFKEDVGENFVELIVKMILEKVEIVKKELKLVIFMEVKRNLEIQIVRFQFLIFVEE